MELYHKKTNIRNKVSQRLIEKYNEADNTGKYEGQNTYLQKMIEKRHVSQPRNDVLNLSSENIKNVRSSVEDILSNESNKKKAIKYVIQIGKSKRNQYSSTSFDAGPRFDRTQSPKRGGGGSGYIQENINSYKISPNRNLSEQKDKNVGLNKYIPKNEYQGTYERPIMQNNNYQNPPDEQLLNEIEISSPMEEEQGGYDKNEEPRIMSRINRVLKDRYEKAKNPPERRNRNIQAMPRIIKHNVYRNNDYENEDVEDLVKTIEELQIANNNLKKDIFNKNNELNLLKNDLDNMQKELEEKRIEHDKEMEDLVKGTDNNPKLKNDYYALLQEYDKNINDFNNLKDDYNQIVDEYNTLKTEKNRLLIDNKNLRIDNSQLKKDYNIIRNDANRAVDEYNNIVDDFNKLEQEHKILKDEYEKMKNLPETMNGEEFNKLNDDYNKLKEENNRLKEENEQIKKDMEEMSQVPKDEDYERLYEGYNTLKNDNEELKKENEKLRNKLDNKSGSEEDSENADKEPEKDQKRKN